MMDKGIKFQATIEGLPLIKFQTEDIINKTQKGSFYMCSLKHYRDLYKDSGDETIGDPYEGKFIAPSDECYLINEEGDKQRIDNKALHTANENDFVYCMFGINPRKYNTFQFNNEIKDKILNVYDTALIITKPYEYFKRIKEKANNNGIELKSDFVNYYDEKIFNLNLAKDLIQGMQNIVFYKRQLYRYQNEYRFTTPNRNNDLFFEMNIGDISSISEILPASDIFRSSIFNQKV